MDTSESQTNLGFWGNKKAKIPKFDEKTPRFGEKSQALETLSPDYTEWNFNINLKCNYRKEIVKFNGKSQKLETVTVTLIEGFNLLCLNFISRIVGVLRF